MDIVRMQVEGGFLDGFDVEFAPGLNVLIGARGTGKTSVIELLRYALGVHNLTGEAERRSLDHARAILADGEITVVLRDTKNEISVTRSASDAEPQFSGTFLPPLILSQTEIESLGLSAASRLRLLDGFVRQRVEIATNEAAAISSIRSVFKEVQALESEVAILSQGLDTIAELQDSVSSLESQLASHQTHSAEISAKQHRLTDLTTAISLLSVRETMLERFESRTREWAAELGSLVADDFGCELWDGELQDDPLAGLRDRYSESVLAVETLATQFLALAKNANGRREALKEQRLVSEGNARALRSEIEQTVEGTGALSRELAQKKITLAQMEAKAKHLRERERRLGQLRLRRNDRIAMLQEVRKSRFQSRVASAQQISLALAPSIKVEIEQYGQYDSYIAALTDVLRGSGMKYNDLSLTLAEQISPLELVELTDEQNFIGLSEITGIPKDRAARLLGHLKEAGTAEVVVAPIEDNVKMFLLDGVDYKAIEDLSAGQRCTVILSLVLQHKNRTLVIDQPEDHLDNAFVATTVIRALIDRSEYSQTILSTHNANIPVLGEARQVIELTSDGRNGFVQVRAPLDDPEAVQAITSVMEGGRTAFKRRAEFYSRHKVR